MSEELSRAGEPMFTLVRRGYDPVEVDGYVSQLHHQLRGLQKPDQAVTDALDRVGSEVSDILKKAHETAREIVESAEKNAAEAKRNADEHAASMVAGAEKRLQDIDIDTDRVWAERARIITDVRELSRQLLNAADLADERFPDEPEDSEAIAAASGDSETTEFPRIAAPLADEVPGVTAVSDEDATVVHEIAPAPDADPNLDDAGSGEAQDTEADAGEDE
jgi:cell division septum initiation protein DivIVA